MAFEVKDLKKKYGEFEKKHGLPGFSELNGDFEIDKIDKESEHFLRVIRKVMMEKVVNSLNFLDMMVNPMSAPRIYHAYIKGMSVDDKKLIDELYGKLGELSIDSLAMEVGYSEEDEAKLIGKVFKTWGEVKPKFKKIMDSMRKPNSEGVKKEREYFG
jgi:hypothetical protein